MATRQGDRGTVQKVKLPFFGSTSNRGTDPDKDQRFVNCFPESRKVDQTEITKAWLVKRPGITFYKQFDPDAYEARGIIEFNDKLYAAYGSEIFEDGPIGGGGVPASVISMTTSTGPVGFRLGNSSVIGDYLFICDGVEGWIIETTGAVTQITDLDFPTPHSPTPVFLDGYIVLAKGSDIFNCALDDPLSWDATNFVSAESFPDAILALARQNNQIVAFGSESTEFFYNAANASGSPFNRNESALIQVGTAAPYSITQTERYCTFIGSSFSGGQAFWIIEGFTPKRVSDEHIERLINSETNTVGIRGYCVRISGHMFYVLNLPTADRTLVYDPDEKLWHEWSTGASSGVFGNRFVIDYANDGDNGYFYGQVSNNGNVCYFDVTAGADSPSFDTGPSPELTSIDVLIRTNRIDMDTTYRKRLHSLRIFMDKTSNSDQSTLSISMSDDDYISFSGGTNYLVYTDLDTPPVLYRLGEFRRRSFEFIHYGQSVGTRYEAMELCYTEGIS